MYNTGLFVSSIACGCSPNNRSIRRPHRSPLLLSLGSCLPRRHRGHHLLGHRLRARQLAPLQERVPLCVRSPSYSLRFLLECPRHHQGVQSFSGHRLSKSVQRNGISCQTVGKLDSCNFSWCKLMRYWGALLHFYNQLCFVSSLVSCSSLSSQWADSTRFVDNLLTTPLKNFM